MPCGGPKKYPRTSSIMQVIFSFWCFEITEYILRDQKLFIGQDSFSFGSIWIILVFVSTTLLKVAKFQ